MPLEKLYLGIPIKRTKKRGKQILVSLQTSPENAQNRWIVVDEKIYNERRTYRYVEKC